MTINCQVVSKIHSKLHDVIAQVNNWKTCLDDNEHKQTFLKAMFPNLVVVYNALIYITFMCFRGRGLALLNPFYWA